MDLEEFRENFDHSRHFAKYLRLFANLPDNSRILREVNPIGAFSYDQWATARILYEIGAFRAMYFNANRGEKVDPIEPPEIFVPDKIREIMDEYEATQKAQKAAQAEISRDFWTEFNGI